MGARYPNAEAGGIVAIRASSKRPLKRSSMGSMSKVYEPVATRFPSGEPTVGTLCPFCRPDDFLCGQLAGGLWPLVDLNRRAEARTGPTLV